MKIKDFDRGEGVYVGSGYRRGDSWVQTTGDHTECGKKVIVLGAGVGADAKGRVGEGVLVRCGGCLLSWVLR